MKKERYDKVEIEIIRIKATDVLVASGGGDDDDDGLVFVPSN